MSRRLKLFTIAISTVAVLLLTIGGVVLADDSRPEGKHFGFRGEKMGGACHNGLLTEVLGLTPEEILVWAFGGPLSFWFSCILRHFHNPRRFQGPLCG